MTSSTSDPTSFSLERHTLDNGLRVVLHCDRTLPLVAINLWYHVGSKNERPGHTGFAHLFEHMLFQGSEHVGTNDHFGYIQQAGGIANGSTSRDRTNYYETLPAHQRNLGLWLESDRMGFLLPAMTEEKMENQRQVVMNERRQRVDNQPYGRAPERVSELLFPADHPYHWPVIGYMEDIESATLDEVREFFATYYGPNNAVLTLAGDFEPDEALADIEAYFGDLPSGPAPPPVHCPPTSSVAEAHETLEDDVQLERVYMGFRIPSYGEREWYAADLLSTVLSSGKSCPLYQELVYRRRIAQSAGCWVYDYEAAGTLWVVATVKPESSAEEVEQVITDLLAEAAVKPPRDADLERARNLHMRRHCERLEKLDNRADLLSQLTTYFDDPGYANRELDQYLELEPNELTAAAQSWLRPEQSATVRVIPRA